MFLILCLVFGGAGVRHPLLQALLEIAGIALLAGVLLWRDRPRLAPLARLGSCLALAICMLPALHLIPLPPALWTTLPGRESALGVARLVGIDDEWHALSLTPDATRRSLLALLPAAALFAVALHLSVAQRLRLLWLVPPFALATVMLAALELATGGAAIIFETNSPRYAVGLFTNSDHQAIFLVVAIMLTGLPLPETRHSFGQFVVRHAAWARIGIVSLLSLGVIVTQSRSGFALLPLSWIVVALLTLGRSLFAPRQFVPILIFVVATYLVFNAGVTQTTFARFETVGEDLRLTYWSNSLWLLDRYSWSGAGFGSLPTVYRAAETLDQLKPSFVNHLHNDYLETVVEGGLAAVILMAASLIIFGLAAMAARRASAFARQAALAPLGAVGVIAMHSLVDYPLRMAAIMSLFGLLAACTFPAPEPTESAQPGPYRKRAAIGLIVALAALWQAASNGFGLSAAIARDAERTVAIDRYNSRAIAQLGADALARRDGEGARRLARRALGITPIDPVAIRTFALATPAVTEPLMMQGAALGWRDEMTQMWLVGYADAQGDEKTAIERMDALLRQNLRRDDIYPELHAALIDPAVRSALVVRLAERPRWRSDFLRSLGKADDVVPGAETLIAMLGKTAFPATLDEIGPGIAALVRSGDEVAAFEMWRSIPGNPRGSDGVADNFDRLDAQSHWGRSTFDWTSAGLFGAVASIQQPSGASGNALHVYSDGVGTGAVLRRTVMLPPGTYRLSYRAQRIAGSADAGFALACGEGAVLNMTASSAMSVNGWTQRVASFTVGETDCGAQALTVRIAGGADAPFEGWLDDLSIVRTQ